jgi:cobalt/nickel transport system permease protein
MSLHLLGHQHAHHHGVLQRFPAGLKLAVALAIIVGTVTLPLAVRDWFIAVGGLLVLVFLLSGISAGFLLRRLLMLSPFVLGVALVNALHPAGRDVWLGLALKSSLCLVTVILVANTTPFSHILRVLQTLRVPGLLITTIALMHRYLFVLADESERMRRARASRTFTAGRRHHWFIQSTLVGQLFIRASERAERIYDAMCARGWQ